MFFQSFQQTNLQHPSTFPNSDSLELFGRLFSVFGKSEIPLLLKIQQKNKKNSELNISIFFVLIFKMAVSKKGCVITERTVSPQHCLPQRGPISKKFLCKSALAQATGAEMAIGASPPIPLAAWNLAKKYDKSNKSSKRFCHLKVKSGFNGAKAQTL